MRSFERSAPVAQTEGNGPLAGEAPDDLGSYGRFLWELMIRQEADCVAKRVAPTIGMAAFALAHAYASAFDRWAEAKETIRHLEAKRPKAERHLAKWHIDDETEEWRLHGVWVAEKAFRKEAIVAARALGIGMNHPAVALQVNVGGRAAMSDDAMNLVGPNREARRIIELDEGSDPGGPVVDAKAEPGR